MMDEISPGGLASSFWALSDEARLAALDGLTSEEIAALDADLDLGARERLLDWCLLGLRDVGLSPARHHRLLIDELSGVERGDVDRLMVFMPPGSAKSTYASVLFPAWFLGRQQGRSVIAASHTTSLAEHFSGRVLSLIREHGATLGLRLMSEGVGSWRTGNRGEYKAAGVGGAITGRRADLALIDDPVSSQEDADSALVRERVWDWYRSELVTRLKPNGRIVLIMTRWHEDDLAGRLLEREGERWRVLRLPALAEAGDVLGRAEGEALWPDWEGVGALREKEKAVGARVWQSLYQQRPSAPLGTLFKVAGMVVHRERPEVVRAARAWDLGGSAKKSADPTVGVLLGVTARGRYVVLDLVSTRGTPGEVEDLIVSTAKADGPGVMIGLPQDPGQAGLAQVQYLVSRLAGFTVRWSPETGSKETRATPVAVQLEAGNLGMMVAPWNAGFTEELAAFPGGRHDDAVDALSRAFMMLLVTARPARWASGGHMER